MKLNYISYIHIILLHVQKLYMKNCRHHAENLWQCIWPQSKRHSFYKRKFLMYTKLLADEVSYSDGTLEYILPFIIEHPLFGTEVCVIKPGKLSMEICVVRWEIQIFRPKKLPELIKKNSVDTSEIWANGFPL